MIDYCIKKKEISKSEVVRLGINKVYQDIKGDL